jgi:hypothetical protein
VQPTEHVVLKYPASFFARCGFGLKDGTLFRNSTKSVFWGIPAKQELHRHELLPTIDVVGSTCQGRIGHDVYRKRSNINRLDHAPDGKHSP